MRRKRSSESAEQTAAEQARASQEALERHLQVSGLDAVDVVEAVNSRRKLLGLAELEDITADKRLDDGLAASNERPELNKQSALRDLKAFSDAASGFETMGKAEAVTIGDDLAKLEAEPGLLAAIQRLSFIERGIDLIEDRDCPFCDVTWDDEQKLVEHLKAKLRKLKGAQKLQQALLQNGAALAAEAAKVIRSVTMIEKLAEAARETGVAQACSMWRDDLEDLKGKLAGIDGIAEVRERLAKSWLLVPPGLLTSVKAFAARTALKPDQTATLDAQTLLTTAQVRLDDYRKAVRKRDAAAVAAAAAKTTYETYRTVMDNELERLYDEVQADFSSFYRTINEDDEATFNAKFSPSDGKLDLTVNFYERGLFPPGAYHSEGHQDGMGVCLYLALMKRLFGKDFTFALLDDVVMSVDSGHRYQFCKLLKTQFPDTQFIITTHDRLWAEQMKSAGPLAGKTSLAFHAWTVDTGPLVESDEEIWDEIDASLNRGKVEVAAVALRHHLEYVSRLLADQLGAPVPFRADGSYELGDLLPNVVRRMSRLFGKAADAAQSWGNHGERDGAAARRDGLSNASGASNVEQWAVNKSVHYNERANFGRTDFRPVVAAFRDLLDCFRCKDCGSWFYVVPRHSAELVRCACNTTNLNLKDKPK